MIAACKWCVWVFLAILAGIGLVFAYYMLYAPYYIKPISARLVTEGPIYPGQPLVFEYTYCIHIGISDVYAEFTDGFVHALTPVRYVDQDGCPVTKRFLKEIPPEWSPGNYTYKVAHHIWENPIRDALIGKDLVIEPPVHFTVLPRP